MTRALKIGVLLSLALFYGLKTSAQPIWIEGTPIVTSTGTFSITLDYGIDRTGNVFIVVYNFNNTSNLSSSLVRLLATQSASQA